MGGHRPFIVPCPFRVTLEEATMTMYRFISWFVLGLPFAFNASGQPAQRQSLEVFAQLGLTPQQVAAIDEGRPVAKVLSWGGPSYVLQYPRAELPGADSFIYWEKVKFGMKPTIRVNHAVIYSARASDRALSTVAIKQLYASHYFHTALDLSVCVDDMASPGPRGFYLLTIKGSEQEGLTGVKGAMLRKIVVDKTRSSLENALAAIKRTVEQAAAGSSR